MMLSTKISPLLIQVFLLVAVLMGGFQSPALAQAVGLKPGTYQCFTLSTLYVPNPERTDSREVARVGAGNVWVRPMVAPQLLLAPAAFGNVVLDGQGNYRFTNIRQGGKYGFNTATGMPTFTGDLGAMKLVEYSSEGTSFVVGWQGTNYQCGLAGPRGAAAVEDNSRQSALLDSAGPALATATAAQVTGHFEGSYLCGQTQTFLQLELAASADGTLTGVFKFGGMRTPEINYSVGSYSLAGTWRGAQFQLKKNKWIVQPPGYQMVDIEGSLTSQGVAGKITSATCSVFAAARRR
jgi:hypothetical protein